MAAKDVDSSNIKKKELDDITTCCICTEVYTDPKALPCIHTFCMKCIQETGLKTNKEPGDEMPCPLCRRMFKIPPEGFRGLPKNFFIERLIQVANVSVTSGAAKSMCDVCMKDENQETGKEIPVADKYCVDCKHKLCEECCTEHGNFKMTKNHKLIPINEHEGGQNVMTNLVPSVCELHEQKILEIYCVDCKTVVCAFCFIDDHKNHEGSDVKKFVDGFRKQIESNAEAINECRSQAETKMAKLLKVKEDIQVRVGNLESDVVTRKDEVKQLADKHATSLLQNLCSIRQIKLKEIQTATDDINTYLSSLETYNSYCQNIMAKGSASDICREFSDLSVRAVELQQQCQPTTEIEIQSFNFCFRNSELKESCDNLIGGIQAHERPTIKETDLEKKLNKMKEPSKSDKGTILCDSCYAYKENENDEVSTATMFCTNCEESQCDNCSEIHRRQKLCKHHSIVPIDEKMKQKLSNVKESSKSEEGTIFCDSCNADKENENDEVPTATMFCTNCEESLCDDCSKAHKKQKLAKDHKVVPIDESMQKRLQKEKMSSKSDEGTIFCDSCKADKENENDEVPTATMSCIDCDESHCDACSGAHKKQRLSKDHEVVPIDGNMKKRLKKEQLSLYSDKSTIFCDSCNVGNENETDEVPRATMFCIDCEETYCDDCCRSHKKQKISKDHKIVPINPNNKNMLSIGKWSAETTFKTLNPIYSSSDCDEKLLKLNKLLDNELRDLLTEENFSKIRHMVERPAIKETDLENFWRFALPYIIQRIKNWNGYVLSAQNIAAMVERTQKQKQVASSSYYTIQERTIYPVSRLDCIAYIINAADSIVVQDILCMMSKFPMAIPLVIPDTKENGKYIIVVPAMQNIIAKWESTPGQIIENHLFSSPFRMIAAVRLGTNKIGKSTILNQLMRKQFMFSSSGEPGSRYGRPLTLGGTVEIVWLTQETCSDTTWKTTVCHHYKGKTEEVAILANLHGDALKYPDTLRYLEHLACSFIVFRMPNSTDDEFRQLRKSISSQNLVPVLVDPKENLDEESDMEAIFTDSLSSDDTQDTVRSFLRSSLNFYQSTNSGHLKQLNRLEKSISLRYIESLKCIKSEEILDIVRKQGCFSIKQLLLNIDVKQHTRWNETLKCLVRFSLDIFNQEQSDAKKSLMYLENQLSRLSSNESVTARAQVSEANEKLRRIIVKAPKKSTAEGDSEEKQHQANFKKAQDELKDVMEKVGNINLGQEHFFRALGQMYEKSFGITYLGAFNSVRDLPSRFADLLISGHAIEMLNGDSGDVQLVWIKAICEKVSKKLPNLKVFVISIIGLQSSGKSTLLNALFSCRFAVSVGRCSRGLFMSMIFLDEKLKKTYGCDAFILIDTEGLCSPEKMNDPKASQKDRLMATFAMGVSNLTMVNILGEGMTEMTEILQIAIVAMARLRGGGIKPDILMVQHLQERNLSKIDQAKGQFCDAINKAFELINKNDVEIGSASEECLTELTARIQSGDIFKHFGAFKDGSSVNSPPSETYHEDIVNLFDSLLKRSLTLEKKSTFERWSNHFESYWNCVRGENFDLNFKNIKPTTDFLYFEKMVTKVKELNDSSLRHHRELFANKIREQINLVIENKQKVSTDSMRTNMLQGIEQKLQAIPHECPEMCRNCEEFKTNYIFLLQETARTEWEEEIRHSLKTYNEKLHESTMKVLIQTCDASIVKQGYFAEFSDLITEELKQALKRRPTGEFSGEEQRDIVDNIWRFLQGVAASKESGPDLHTRMTQALRQEYVTSGIWPNVLQDFTTEITVEDLSRRTAIKSKFTQFNLARMLNYEKLTKDQMTSLISDLEQLVMVILQSRREDYFKTGLNFDEGMVTEIKTKFPYTMKQHEEKFNITLHDKFKMDLYIYTFQRLRKRMTDLQSLWNSQNIPSEILRQKRDDYIDEIGIRLKYGFSCAGEGEVFAKTLCKSIKLNAIRAVKDALWTTNSEKVRLHYFEQLIKEVAGGKKERALVHIANPKASIESWFANEVDSLNSEKSVQDTYRSTLKHKINRVKQRISNSNSKADIDKIVKEQIKNADDQYYSQVDPKDDDFNAFRISIVRIIESFMDSVDSR